MKLKNFVLGIGIVVVYGLVLWQGIQAFYPEPMWEDFCSAEVRVPKTVPIDRVTNCEYPSGMNAKEVSCAEAGGYFVYDYDDEGCLIDGYCDECQIEYEDARDEYSRNVFIVSLIIGILTIIIGFTILKIEPVGSALIGSGIWAVFFGTVVNWRNFGNFIRFGLLLVVLIVLIWITVRLNKGKK
jgi:hypothetical protein